jgi:penicillin amidase
VIEIWADSYLDLAAGIGFAHAYDRLVQMSTMRLAGQGRTGECLRSDDFSLQVDTLTRTMGFAHHAAREVGDCPPELLQLAEAYCRGVQYYLDHGSIPWELKLVGYRPEKWTVADVLLTVKLMGYVGLAQSQQQMEKFLIQAIRGGTQVAKLKKLFAPHLDGLSDEFVGYIRKLQLAVPSVPLDTRFLEAVPKLTASNSWAVAGDRTVSGFPFECHDPHLACHLLPQAWYELVIHVGDESAAGVSVPGVPAMIMGRNKNVSLGFTYGYMDTIDYFIEECRDGRYRQGDQWCEFQTRTEILRRRGKDPLTLTVRENDRGVLECDPFCETMPDGYYLTCAWSAHRDGTAGLLDLYQKSYRFQSVPEAQKALRGGMISANWVLADRHGNIGYQQSGLLPNRSHSGLYPLPGWKEESQWRGLVDSDRLTSELNPPCGFIVTANGDHNDPTGPLSINLCMSADRASRIRELLAADKKFTLEDMKGIQGDLVSKHAERYMRLLRPWVPGDLPAGRLLLDWDLGYDAGSRGATLFERVYEALLSEVYGERFFGAEAWENLIRRTALPVIYFRYLDAPLLDENGAGDEREWFGDRGREATCREVLGRVLAASPPETIPRWGKVRKFKLRNILLGTDLPMIPRINYGPIALEGGRGSVAQGIIANVRGRFVAVGPSYRFVTDLGSGSLETVLAGGPSGRPWSRYYLSDIRRWLKYGYKLLSI